ncbi:MAG: regulatory iron-sulfur-containing complex subunit RicT [Deferribacterota bacterium]|nr:regulatory iron-sulfur-containing complex subunit RicT [Deferribacterota bacterium]
MNNHNIAYVTFRRAGKIFNYKYNKELELNNGDLVVVEDDKGINMATVVKSNININNCEDISNDEQQPSIIRKANEGDILNYKKNITDAKKALQICKKLAEKAKLEMKLIHAEYTLDRLKLTFFYTADDRIDFRQLVKDLARIFRTRIEMRQIGVRDSTKILGGIGICGKEFCCSSFLRNFDSISITIAQNQNLLFNPTKITGACGRLMCCLLYEKDLYAEPQLSEDQEYIKLVDEKAGGEL